MESALLRAAVCGSSSPFSFNLPTTEPFADELSRRSSPRAILLAAGINALREGVAAPPADEERARLYAQALRRQKRVDHIIMPFEVAEAARQGTRAYIGGVLFEARRDEELFPHDLVVGTFGVTAILRRLAQAKVEFPMEMGSAYVRLVDDLSDAGIDRRLILELGGGAARKAALCERDYSRAVRIARYFYEPNETPDLAPVAKLEEFLPKKRRVFSHIEFRLLEFLKLVDPRRAREYLFANPSRLPTSMIRTAVAMTVNLTREDAAPFEEFLERTGYSVFNARVPFDGFILYANALVAKTRADSKLRRKTLEEAKKFAHKTNGDVPNLLRYLPLDEWEEIFQRTPRQILNMPLKRSQRRDLLAEARVSYLIFDSSDEWGLELVQTNVVGEEDDLLRFLSGILRVKHFSQDFGRNVVDVVLHMQRKKPRSERRLPLCLAALFEPYPWRKKFANDFVHSVTTSGLKKEWRPNDVPSLRSWTTSFEKILFPWLPRDVRERIYSDIMKTRRSNGNSRSPREDAVLSFENYQATDVLRKYMEEISPT